MEEGQIYSSIELGYTSPFLGCWCPWYLDPNRDLFYWSPTLRTLDLGLSYWLSCILGLWTRTALYHWHSWLYNLQMANCESSQYLYTCEPVLIINLLSVSITVSEYISYWFGFSREHWWIQYILYLKKINENSYTKINGNLLIH